MAREIEARLRLSAVDRTQKAFGAIQRRLDDVDRKTRQLNRTQAAFNKTQLALSRGLTAVPLMAAAYGIKTAITDFAQLERRMARVGITADASSDQIKQATQRVQGLAKEFALPLDQGIVGLETLTSAGLNLEEAMAFLPSVLATAQASGAATEDVANTAIKAADALKLSAGEMQQAFDIMVAGGKAGQFELKDMAQYIPELANSFASLGYEGQPGLQKLIAMLQTLREDTGSASAAATQAQNIFGKMYSEETSNKFKKFGIDIRKEMEAAKAAGEDAVSAFVRISKEAIDGDLSKLPQLFTDQEFRLGMQSLITSQESFEKFLAAVNGAKVTGTVFRDLKTVMETTQTDIDRLSSSWGELLTSVGKGAVDLGLADLMSGGAQAIDDERAYFAGLSKEEARGGSKGEAEEQYRQRYEAIYGDLGVRGTWDADFQKSFRAAMARFGRGEAKTPYDDLQAIEEVGGSQRFPGMKDADDRARLQKETEQEANRNNIDGLPLDRGSRLPSRRPDPADAEIALSEQDQRRYYGRGRQSVPGAVADAEAERRAQPPTFATGPDIIQGMDDRWAGAESTFNAFLTGMDALVADMHQARPEITPDREPRQWPDVDLAPPPGIDLPDTAPVPVGRVSDPGADLLAHLRRRDDAELRQSLAPADFSVPLPAGADHLATPPDFDVTSSFDNMLISMDLYADAVRREAEMLEAFREIRLPEMPAGPPPADREPRQWPDLAAPEMPDPGAVFGSWIDGMDDVIEQMRAREAEMRESLTPIRLPEAPDVPFTVPMPQGAEQLATPPKFDVNQPFTEMLLQLRQHAAEQREAARQREIPADPEPPRSTPKGDRVRPADPVQSRIDGAFGDAAPAESVEIAGIDALRIAMEGGGDSAEQSIVQGAQSVAQSGQAAGQAITQAASAINEQGAAGGSAFRSMLQGMGPEIGQAIGMSAAQAFKANVGTINVQANVRTTGGALAPATGNKGKSMLDAGTTRSGAEGRGREL